MFLMTFGELPFCERLLSGVPPFRCASGHGFARAYDVAPCVASQCSADCPQLVNSHFTLKFVIPQPVSSSVLATLVAVSSLVGAYLHHLWEALRAWAFPKECGSNELLKQVSDLRQQLLDRPVTTVEYPFWSVIAWSILWFGFGLNWARQGG